MKHKLLHLQSLLAVALCVIMSVTFSGCGDDDDEPEKDSKNLETILVGTWTADGEYIVLNNNGTGRYYIDYDSYVNNGKCDIITSWSCRDNTLRMTVDSEFEGEVYSVTLLAQSVSENKIDWLDEYNHPVTWSRYK